MVPIDKSYLVLLGMVAGFTSICLGYKLFLKGIDGSSSFEGEIKKVKLSMRNAAPGLFFALFGAAVIIAGIYKKDIHTIQWDSDGYTETISKGDQDRHNVNKHSYLLKKIFEEAVAYRKAGDFQSAKVLYLSLIKTDDSLYEVHNNLANIYLLEQNYSSALNHAKEAIRQCRTNNEKAAYYDTLSRIYNGQSNFRNAIEAIQTAIQLDPSDQDYKTFLDELNKRNQALR